MCLCVVGGGAAPRKAEAGSWGTQVLLWAAGAWAYAAGQPLPGPVQPQNQGWGWGEGGGSSPPHRAEDEKHQAKGERGMDRDTPGFAQGAPSKTQIPFVIP